MTPLCLPLEQLRSQHAPLAGGKAFALSRLLAEGFPVPRGLCILADAYRRFVDSTALGEQIRLELGRKEFRNLRWEELWDAALRIRHLFGRTAFPAEVERELSAAVEATFGSASVAVRSSALGEDSRELSFAGLHESVLNVVGTAAVLEQVKRVWASLWSDAALLYRQELGLEVEKSAMAVLVQRFVPGGLSGVIFTRSPLDPGAAVLEAVSGLAKGLVDGSVEPERWEIDRGTGRVRSHRGTRETRRVVAGVGGVQLVEEPERDGRALLTEPQVLEVYAAARRAEHLFASPQDVEWTFGAAGLQLLQSRPVTAGKKDKDATRLWNLSLRRSFENLSGLRKKIEGSILPAMQEEAERLGRTDLAGLSEADLADQVLNRQEALDRWNGVYRQDLIPFAHGMRLFGQVYNDALAPQDPFAFVALLRPERLESMERNRLLCRMANRLRETPGLRERLGSTTLAESGDHELLALLGSYRERYGNLLGIAADRDRLEDHLRTLLLEMSDASRPLNEEQASPDRDRLEGEYLEHFEPQERQRAAELLELGRASYRIRDDDNVYLDRFKALLGEAEQQGLGRLRGRGLEPGKRLPARELVRALRDPGYRPRPETAPTSPPGSREVEARQLLGQPASHGIATGPARVVLQTEDLFRLRKGEILVCDAIDPAMTFAAPLAAGIVERRGGMLIHGAIIAREYGIPCVTGIPEATRRIADGDRVTVDGYLGIVVIATS